MAVTASNGTKIFSEATPYNNPNDLIASIDPEMIYGSAVTPEYFEPDSSIKIDTSTQVYPSSGQDFQIVFDDPNAGLASDSQNRVTYISIKVKFKYSF